MVAWPRWSFSGLLTDPTVENRGTTGIFGTENRVLVFNQEFWTKAGYVDVSHLSPWILRPRRLTVYLVSYYGISPIEGCKYSNDFVDQDPRR